MLRVASLATFVIVSLIFDIFSTIALNLASFLLSSCSFVCLSNKSSSACVAFLSINFCLSSCLINRNFFDCSSNDKLVDSISKFNNEAYCSLADCKLLGVIAYKALFNSFAEVTCFIKFFLVFNSSSASFSCLFFFSSSACSFSNFLNSLLE